MPRLFTGIAVPPEIGAQLVGLLAIYAAVAANPDLDDLQSEHERLARRAGAEPERRKFTPHVTLTRLRRAAGPEAVAAYLACVGIVPRLSFTATEVALFSARESRGGGP